MNRDLLTVLRVVHQSDKKGMRWTFLLAGRESRARKWHRSSTTGCQKSSLVYAPGCPARNIDKGKQWFTELQDFLGEATSCIICVTSENVRSPWIYYETGAIAAKKQNVLVCPYLVGIGTSMIADGPLAQYQCTEATKADTLALIRSLNKAIATPHDEGLLCGNFESKWSEFEQELNKILAMTLPAPADFVETDADVLTGYRLSAEARNATCRGSRRQWVC